MQTIDRVVTLLELLSKNKAGLGIYLISEEVKLPLGTVHRMLNALKEKGYVSQDQETKKYKLGNEVLTLAFNLLNDLEITKIAKPIMEELSTKHSQLFYLSILENNKTTCVDMVNNSDKMGFYVKIGSVMPAYCASSAKAIVAFLDEVKIDEIIDNAEKKKYTIYTKTYINEIKKDLYRVKENGYAVCDEEMELNVKAISSPIRDRYNKTIASITIVYLKNSQFDEEQLIKDLKSASSKISKLLGASE